MTDLKQVEAIVNAVLYEGYMLYPYRPSSVKNRQRWTFGGIYPRDCAAKDESLRAAMQTECLVRGGPDTIVEIRVRFLHLLKREIGQFEKPLAELLPNLEPSYKLVPNIEVGQARHHAWEEAVERVVIAESLVLHDLVRAPLTIPFRFPGQRTLDPLRAPDGLIPGVLIGSAVAVEGAVKISAKELGEPQVFKLTVIVENLTPVDRDEEIGQDAAQKRAFASTHTILSTKGGEFISLLDTPDSLAEAAAQCDNQGTWPVMAGERGAKDIVLSSPIILYDYPEIAPESPGDLFDSTEIDEILTLRILAMTDEEKRDMAAVDDRARALLERTEALTAADMVRLHGALRNPRAGTSLNGSVGDPPQIIDAKPQLAFLRVHGTELRVGDRVRLRPKSGGDVMDMVLKDEVAIIEAIERDFENRVHVAVVLENDPGREFGLDRMPGHRFFFSPEEIEAVSGEHPA